MSPMFTGGWTESRAVLGRGQAAVVQALEEIAQALPFRRLGIDTDNGSDFLKGHVWAGVRSSSRADDPTRKTTTPSIEQKNWTHVRKLMGWGRLRYGPGGGGHERSVSPRAAPEDERLSALGEAGTQGW